MSECADTLSLSPALFLLSPRLAPLLASLSRAVSLGLVFPFPIHMRERRAKKRKKRKNMCVAGVARCQAPGGAKKKETRIHVSSGIWMCRDVHSAIGLSFSAASFQPATRCMLSRSVSAKPTHALRAPALQTIYMGEEVEVG